MSTQPGHAPLVTGDPVAAPRWFADAIADAPQRGSLSVDGADIELLTWGRPEDPGILFLHGKGAHADWWSFIAPFFSHRFRVAAISWSGMGRSGRRKAYSEDVLATEALAALRSTDVFPGPGRPFVVAHSFGSLMATRLCEKVGDQLGGIVLIDPPIFSEAVIAERRRSWSRTVPKTRHVYPSLEDALRRFRFAPPQPCENLFIADFIARRSLVQVDNRDEQGWRWCVDPRHWAPHRQSAIHDLPRKQEIPYTVIVGEQSALYTAEDLRYVRQVCGDQVPVIGIPCSAHHVMVDQPLALASVLRTIVACPPRE